MAILQTLFSSFAPIFLVISPLTSYTDQILSIHRTRTSAGFSLDIPLIMLLASILKIFYWPTARYDLSLFIQALVMLVVQCVLLKVALDNRPGWRAEQAAGGGQLWKGKERGFGWGVDGAGAAGMAMGKKSEGRLWGFWRWRKQRPYWEFLSLLTLSLFTVQILLATTTPMSFQTSYASLLGYIGLTIEATLPLPQLHSNYSSRSCKGFRVSVLGNWLLGDAMKMAYFFTSAPGQVPWAFKACGIFQACCDCGLGAQYWMYGDGSGSEKEKTGHYPDLGTNGKGS
ncbi:hypothetical protein MMC25_004198 [Agyrium rufum]|nr:hypothetical protein [Agyrium rufum]